MAGTCGVTEYTAFGNWNFLGAAGQRRPQGTLFPVLLPRGRFSGDVGRQEGTVALAGLFWLSG